MIVWTTDDRQRWMVEVRVGGPSGGSRFQEVPTEYEAVALAERCRRDSPQGEWKDITRLVKPTNHDQGTRRSPPRCQGGLQ